MSQSHLARGGVESGLVTLCRELPRHGWDVCLGLARGRRFHDPEAFRREHPGVRIDSLAPASETREGRIRAVRASIARQTPDVVLATRVPEACVAVAQLKREGAALRVGVNIRGCSAQQIADVARLREDLDFAVGASRLLARTIAAVAKLDEHRVFALPSGVVTPAVAPARSFEGPLQVAYIGRLDEHDKRVMMLPRLAAELTARKVPYELHVVGEGSAVYGSADRLRAALSAHAGGVVWHGWLDATTLRERILARMHCSVSFSPREGAPTSIREAMAFGVVPVMVAFTGVHSEGLYRHGYNCLLFDVDAVAEAAGAIANLHSDRAALAGLSRAAADSIDAEQTVLGVVGRWAQALDRVVALPVRRGGVIEWDLQRSPGRLQRLGVPAGLADRLRSLVPRGPAARPEEEWPSDMGLAEPELLAAIEGVFALEEGQALQAVSRKEVAGVQSPGTSTRRLAQ